VVVSINIRMCYAVQQGARLSCNLKMQLFDNIFNIVLLFS